jgi:hypothetical protein
MMMGVVVAICLAWTKASLEVRFASSEFTGCESGGAGRFVRETREFQATCEPVESKETLLTRCAQREG